MIVRGESAIIDYHAPFDQGLKFLRRIDSVWVYWTWMKANSVQDGPAGNHGSCISRQKQAKEFYDVSISLRSFSSLII